MIEKIIIGRNQIKLDLDDKELDYLIIYMIQNKQIATLKQITWWPEC